MNTHNLLGGLTQQQFLDEYWQQKPLLVRQAFPDIQPPCSTEELAGLCCDTDAPSRIVIEQGETPWQVIHSPLQEDHFTQLPETHWTLLINDFEHYYPQLLTLLEPFRFIPDWRIDDLMISYAPTGGSVGPHWDEYDVFLIQATGSRHWMLDSTADANALLPECDLKILTAFNSQQEWTLQPGDMLYLPPKLAHYGIAKNHCMTYSVGFRSPSQQELIESWLDHQIKNHQITSRYNDAKRTPQIASGKIEQADIAALKSHLLSALNAVDSQQNKATSFTRWLGSYLTEPKKPEQETYRIDDHLQADITCLRHPNQRIAWMEHDHTITIFINGVASDWPDDIRQGIQYICATHQYSSQSLEKNLHNETFKTLFQELISKEILYYPVTTTA